MANYAYKLLGLLCMFGLSSILLLATQFKTETLGNRLYQFDGQTCKDISKDIEQRKFYRSVIVDGVNASSWNLHTKNAGRVAIIIPYRNRTLQLWEFLKHMNPIWQDQNIDYKLFVIEQHGNGLFNRGKLLNVGFQEALNAGHFDCFIFHDVDILLENPQCSYSCHQNISEVNHLSAYLDKYDYKHRKYKIRCRPKEYLRDDLDNVGGILMVRHSQFVNINGFSNLFWGWGGEDDDLALRIWKKGLSVYEQHECRFCMLKHGHPEENHVKHRLINISLLRQDTDGLSSLRYKVLRKHHTHLYTTVLVDIGSPSDELLGIFRKKIKHKEHCDGTMLLGRDMPY